MHLASRRAQILNADVKICQRAVAQQTVQELRGKHVMALILVVHVLHQWIAINRVCVREFLNQIFLKMLLVKS
jgi:hypothetical protein